MRTLWPQSFLNSSVLVLCTARWCVEGSSHVCPRERMINGRPAPEEGVEADASRVMGMEVTTAGLGCKSS